MISKLTTVLFDLDGTLLDTAPDLAYALNKVLQTHGKQPLPFEQIRPLASAGSPGLLGLGFQITPQDYNYEALRQEFFEAYHGHLCIDTELFPGMTETLNYIESNNFRWGIVTNKPTFLAKELLHTCRLLNRSGCLIGGDMTINKKPAPDSLLLACKQMAVDPKECFYVGDAERDIQAAKAANMSSIAALYGYIQADESPKDWNADYTISQPTDMIELLNKIQKEAIA